MRILSWNVLFRPYEEKYNPSSNILVAYTENERIKLIVAFLQPYFQKDTIICLQECSIDLIIAIKYKLPSNFEIVYTPTSNNDFIATICSLEHRFVIQNYPETEVARAYLVIYNQYFCIVNCHLVPQRYVNENVLSFIDTMFTKSNKFTIIAGDFNEKSGKVFRRLGHKYTVPRFGFTYKNREIDCILVNRRFKYTTENVYMDTSDHNAIILKFL